MSQAPIVRASAPVHDRRQDRPGPCRLQRGLLIGSAAGALLLAAAPALGQQYQSVGGSSVTVDYGVLDSLGAAGPNLPGMLSGGGYAAPAPYSYGQAPVPGQLLAPPPAAPRSTLTTGQMPAGQLATGSTGGEQVIKLIPPSQLKRTTAAAAPAPAPAPAPQPTQQTAVPPAPPPPSAVEEIPAATPPTPAPPPPAPAAPPAAVPTPEPPAMAQTTPPPAPPEEPQQAAAPAPPPVPAAPAAPEPAAPAAAEPPPAPAETQMSAGGALADPDGGNSDAVPPVEEAAPAPAAEAPAPDAPAAEAPAESSLADAFSSEPPAAEEAGAEGADTQTAALPSPAMVEGQISIDFAEGASDLTPGALAALDEIAGKLRADDALRVQLLAYAKAIDDNTSRARRMSLSRALAVRAYLIEKGVRSTRMDVRALGSSIEGEPADRVDIIPQAQ